MDKYQPPIGGHVSLETHSYDGKLRESTQHIREWSREEKQMIFERLKHRIDDSNYHHESMRRTAMQVLDRLLHETVRNFDHTNKVHACDIVCEIDSMYEEYGVDETLSPLIEQLVDIVRSGQCPQGRCTRLMQIYTILKWKN